MTGDLCSIAARGLAVGLALAILSIYYKGKNQW